LAEAHGTRHEGAEKTLCRLRASFYTPAAARLVKEFIQGCKIYQKINKIKHLHPAGLLQPLHVPSSVWSDIAMDFIEGFPRVARKSIVLIVVDRFLKYVHFIALGHWYMTAFVAKKNFIPLLGYMAYHVQLFPDRDLVFTSKFWIELFKLSGVKLKLNSALHPQTNGQSEVTNQIWGVYLRCLAGDHPKNWLRWPT
jgi:hypothetical protein